MKFNTSKTIWIKSNCINLQRKQIFQMSLLYVKQRLHKMIQKYLGIEYKYIKIKYSNNERIRIQLPNYLIGLCVNGSTKEFPQNVTSLGIRTKLKEIPIEFITAFDQLTCLNLSNNQLEELPANISALTKLKHINISNNNFQNIPKVLKTLPDLREINLGNNKIENMTNQLSDYPKIEILILSGNKLKVITTDISTLTELVALDLSKNKIKNIPKEVFYLPNLFLLEINSNEIVDLPKLDKKSTISQLFLNNNKIKNFPSKFLEWQYLYLLELRNNRISVIEWSTLLKLKDMELNLSNNLFPDNWEQLFIAFARLNHIPFKRIFINNHSTYVYYNNQNYHDKIYTENLNVILEIIETIPVQKINSNIPYFISIGSSDFINILEFTKFDYHNWTVSPYFDGIFEGLEYYGNITNTIMIEMITEFITKAYLFEIIRNNNFDDFQTYILSKWNIKLEYDINLNNF